MYFRCSDLDKVSNTGGRKHSKKGKEPTAIVREHRCVAGCEIEGACDGTAEEDGGLRLAAVEVEPFFGL